jgi:hypothetical protein
LSWTEPPLPGATGTEPADTPWGAATWGAGESSAPFLNPTDPLCLLPCVFSDNPFLYSLIGCVGRVPSWARALLCLAMRFCLLLPFYGCLHNVVVGRSSPWYTGTREVRAGSMILLCLGLFCLWRCLIGLLVLIKISCLSPLVHYYHLVRWRGGNWHGSLACFCAVLSGLGLCPSWCLELFWIISIVLACDIESDTGKLDDTCVMIKCC